MGEHHDTTAGLVRALDAREAPDVIHLFGAAFASYPVMRYVLGGPTAGDDPRLRTLVGFFVRTRVLRGEPLFGIADGGALVAAAMVSSPHGPPSPPDVAALRQRTWAELGADARARYEAFGATCAPFLPEGPHLHLNMIGVQPARQGRGLARRLLEHVHGLARGTPGAQGVSLTTEHPANVGLYAHVGYPVVGEGDVAHDLHTWVMFRPN